MRPLITRVTIGIGMTFSAALAQAQDPGVTAVKLETNTPTVSGGETVRWVLSVKRDGRAAPPPAVFSIESSQDALTRFVSRTVEIPAGQDRVLFDMGTAAALIRTPLTVTATLKAPTPVRAGGQLEIVPALIKQLTLSTSSMTGTFGTAINATVELKSPAPSSGITLYIGPRYSTPSIGTKRMNGTSTVVVPAGSRIGTFVIRYDDLLSIFSDSQFDNREFNPEFEAITRTIRQVVAIDPQGDGVWSAIPDRAVPFTYVLNPLRISAITAQPTTLAVGAEAMGTFTLNAAPGPNERATVYATGATRAVALGTSCQSAPTQFSMILAQGTTTQSFKICAKPVTATTTSDVTVTLRSGQYRVSVTVHP